MNAPTRRFPGRSLRSRPRPRHRLTVAALNLRRTLMPIIEASNLSKTYRVSQKKEGLRGALRGLFRREYREIHAVEGVSFTIEPGEMVAFLGPNGAGKTTTLKMLSGLIYPSAGTARVLGFVPWERADA